MKARMVLTLASALLAGSCGGGSDGPHGTPAGFLYAAAYAGPNTFPAAIYGFAVYPGGALSPVPGSPAPTSDGGAPLAITRDSKLLYTTNSHEVTGFDIGADGSLTAAPAATLATSDTPMGLVAHPSADFLYLSLYSGVLAVLAVDPATGALSQTSSVTLGNQFLKNSAVMTPAGGYLFQNDVSPDDLFSATSLQVAGFSAQGATGALSAVPGSPVTPTTHASAAPEPMAIDPAGKFLYVGYQFAVINVGFDGGVAAFTIDAASGALTAVPGSPFDVGGVPNSVAVDSSGRFLLVSAAIVGATSTNCLVVLAIDPASGALTPVSGSPFGLMQRACGPVVADPSGPYFYVGTTLETENTPAIVFALSIDTGTGALTPVGQSTIPDNKLGVSFMALTH
jgi:6-phosphogluconolactonase (cycloisomerase 2 family)